MNLWMDERIKEALYEDIYMGDVTTDAIFIEPTDVTATLIAKDNGVVAGIEVFKRVFYHVDSNVELTFFVNEGESVCSGQMVATLKGDAASILKGERVALNFIQRMSGIATSTRAFVEKVSAYNTMIVDTRKTVPLLREFDKWAVRLGGGKNHRMGLFDAVMIKDNHIDAAGSITEAVKRVKHRVGHTVKIEVEVQTLLALQEALDLNVDIIMLDNMSNDQMKQAVDIVSASGKSVILEASGNMSLERVESVAQTGVDVISVGALTHSVIALDLSLKMVVKG